MKEEIRKIFWNTSAQLVGKAFSAAATLVTLWLIGRQYRVEGLGVFLLMTGFASYFYLLTDFGINAVVSRELSQEPENQTKLSKVFGSLLSFRLLESFVIVLILVLVLPLIPFKLLDPQTLRWGIIVGLVTIFSQAIYNSCTAVFQSRLVYQKATTASIIGNLTFLLLVFWLSGQNAPLIYLVAANSLGAILVSLIALYYALKLVGKISLKPDWRLVKILVLKSLPLGLGIILTVIVAKADQFLLAVLALSPTLSLSNDSALGNYGSAYKIFENLLVFPTFFVNAVYPLLVINYRVDEKKFKRLFWGGLIFLIVFSSAVSMAGWFLAPLVFALMGAGEFILAPAALRVLLLSLPLFFCSAFLLFVLITQGQEKKVPYIYLAAAIFNVGLNLFFIPQYGFMASAVITGLTELLILMLVGYFSFKLIFKVNNEKFKAQNSK